MFPRIYVELLDLRVRGRLLYSFGAFSQAAGRSVRHGVRCGNIAHGSAVDADFI